MFISRLFLPCGLLQVWLMEDDRHILAVLSCQDRVRRGGGGGVVLNPDSLSGETALYFSNISQVCPPLEDIKCNPPSSFTIPGDLLLSILVCLSGGKGGGSSSHHSSDCLVITIMELPEESPSSDSLSMLNVLGVYRPSSLDSLPCNLPAQKFRAWTSRSFPRCLLGALCLVSLLKIGSTSNIM